MSAKKEANEAVEPEKEVVKPEEPKPIRCFVIMPFSSPDGYENGHFDRVYRHIIKPACELAGVIPERTDDGLESGYILAKMLRMLTEYELAICDMSAVNANVFYELGVRQSFGKPVTLIKDEKSRRIFDVQGFSSIEYDSTLRIDKVQTAIEKIAQALRETLEKQDEIVNSIQPFLEMKVAEKPKQIEISRDTEFILARLASIEQRISGHNPFYTSPFELITANASQKDINLVKDYVDIKNDTVTANEWLASIHKILVTDEPKTAFASIDMFFNFIAKYENNYAFLLNRLTKNSIDILYEVILFVHNFGKVPPTIIELERVMKSSFIKSH